MSMPVNHLRSLTLAGLPLIVGIAAIGIAIWFGIQSNPLPAGSDVALHPAMENLPADQLEPPVLKEHLLAQMKRNDLFFRLKEKTLTEKPVEQLVTLEELYLTTIAQGKGGNYCLLNNKIYREGQTGKGFQVTKIAVDRVYFATPVESFFLMPGQKAAIRNGKLIPYEERVNNDTRTLAEKSSTTESQETLPPEDGAASREQELYDK